MHARRRNSTSRGLHWRSALVGGLILTFLAVPLSSCSPPESVERPKVVILTPLSLDLLDESIAGIKDGLRTAGYDGAKIELQVVNAGGQMQMLGSYAREIVAGHPSIVVPVSTPATQAVVGVAPESQSIVFSTVTDPAAAKVPPHPRNITGVSDIVDYAANVDLLQQLFPNASRVGTIYNPADAAATFGLERIKPLFAAKGIDLTVVPATNSNDAVNAARSLVGRVDAIYIGSDSNAAAAIPGIVSVARASRVPIIASDAESVRKGALAAVSVDYRELGKAGAQLIVDVLRSGKPAGEFPRVGFVGDALVLNPRSAQGIGYEFPASILARRPQMVGAKDTP